MMSSTLCAGPRSTIPILWRWGRSARAQSAHRGRDLAPGAFKRYAAGGAAWKRAGLRRHAGAEHEAARNHRQPAARWRLSQPDAGAVAQRTDRRHALPVLAALAGAALQDARRWHRWQQWPGGR